MEIKYTEIMGLSLCVG